MGTHCRTSCPIYCLVIAHCYCPPHPKEQHMCKGISEISSQQNLVPRKLLIFLVCFLLVTCVWLMPSLYVKGNL